MTAADSPQYGRQDPQQPVKSPVKMPTRNESQLGLVVQLDVSDLEKDRPLGTVCPCLDVTALGNSLIPLHRVENKFDSILSSGEAWMAARRVLV